MCSREYKKICWNNAKCYCVEDTGIQKGLYEVKETRLKRTKQPMDKSWETFKLEEVKGEVDRLTFLVFPQVNEVC